MKTKLTREAVARYVTRAFAHCPFCGSDQVTGDAVDIDGMSASQEVTCDACNEEWRDVYTLVGISVEGDAPPGEPWNRKIEEFIPTAKELAAARAVGDAERQKTQVKPARKQRPENRNGGNSSGTS